MSSGLPQTESAALFNSISSLFSKYGPAVLNGLIVVSTISGQSLIKKLTFVCPCAYPLNILQSSVFIFGPCVAFFLFAVLINQNTWRLLHGCCFRAPSTRHPLSTSILYWIQITGQALIAPVAWLFVCLLDGDYYSCLRAAEFCWGPDRCPNESAVCGACVCTLEAGVISQLQSQSRVLAWSLLIVAGLVALFATCLIRMCDRYTFVQSQYVKMYRETEQQVFDEMAKEMATSVAKDSSRAFFSRHKLHKEDWDALSSLPTLEDPFMLPYNQLVRNRRLLEEDNDNNYTTLQKWGRMRGKIGDIGEGPRNGVGTMPGNQQQPNPEV